MSFGESTRQVFLSMSIDSAFELATKAGATAGKVLDSNKMTNTITIKTRYGLNAVKLRINLSPYQEGTQLSIQSHGADIWGGAARKGTEKFLKALGNVDG